jgi:hypothetical protein
MTDRTRRLLLAVTAAAAAGAAAGLMPAPAGLEPSGPVRIFAALAAAAIAGVIIVPLAVGRQLRRRPIWIATAVLALLLGIGAFITTGSVQRACTARYDGRAVMVGTQWTPLGEQYARQNPGLSNDELLFDSAGVADRLWTRDSIDRCRTLVSGTYFLWIPLLVACLFATVQAVPQGTLPAGVRAGAIAPASQDRTAARYDVFISYRHGERDAEFARALLAALEGQQYAVAIDERDFAANASFLTEMERCIRESRYTVAVVSARYLGSGNCKEEAIVCKVLDMGDRQRRLIPMLIESVALPAWLFGIVGIDCTKPDPVVDPFEKLRATLGAPLSPPAGKAV